MRYREFLFPCFGEHLDLHSFPTRRSSDLYVFANVIQNVPVIATLNAADAILTLAALDFIERSEEHTSELQSRGHLVCRLLLENQKSTAPSARSRSGSSASRCCSSAAGSSS